MKETKVEQKKTWVPREVEEPRPHGIAAWEMIDNGRYMPRRTRGSFPGRELG